MEGGPAGRELVETTPGKPEWYRSPRGPDQTTAGPETTEGTSIEPATAPEAPLFVLVDKQRGTLKGNKLGKGGRQGESEGTKKGARNKHHQK
ncbi:hypothetical protein NDU88_003149 [Pleurodeles waltl]|uniref:Uncharacterized protein n=1 Tax=Pleurodeles waltl TaxID=8319 RepID=A0AAV7MRM8_PLEWA|nr:hypothetical protein NDU88_003149 [Pleurodeles waltl]